MPDLLDQTCPHCGLTEAAGYFCTKCGRITQESWKHAPIRSEAQRASSASLAASRSKENGLGARKKAP